MAQVLVLYDTRSGNTEKMAELVANGARSVSGIEVKVKKIQETSLEDLENSDAIIVGSPTYYGLMSAPVKELFDQSVKIHGKLEGKVGAAFTSSGGTASGAETTILSILDAMLIHGMIVQGRHDGRHYGAASVGAPQEPDARYCEELGRRTAELARLVKKKGTSRPG